MSTLPEITQDEIPNDIVSLILLLHYSENLA